MARPTAADLFGETRVYLDTDEQNLPDSLLDLLLRRVWFQAVNVEREWRFLTKVMTITVPIGTVTSPMAFAPAGSTDTPVPATRIDYLRNLTLGNVLRWLPLHEALAVHGDAEGGIYAWSETVEAGDRQVRWFAIPAMDTDIEVSFYATPQYPATPDESFSDLPEEFDAAFRSGLLAEAYMREEDPELYDVHRSMFQEQLGYIRQRWKASETDPLVMASGFGPVARASHLPPGF